VSSGYYLNKEIYMRSFEEISFRNGTDKERLYLTYHCNSDIVNVENVYSRSGHIGDAVSDQLAQRRKDTVMSWSAEVEPRKNYATYAKVKLPVGEVRSEKSFEEIVQGRRSLRNATSHKMSINQLAYVLQNSVGVTRKAKIRDMSGNIRSMSYRAVPSGGALYPVECYVIPMTVEDLETGIYHYNPYDHALECLDKKFTCEYLDKIFMNDANVMHSGVFFVLSALFRRSALKYGERAYRYILLEAGAISEHIMLTAEALGLRGVMIGGYVDAMLNGLIGCNGVDESVIVVSSVGLPGKEQ
jgi:SagB-type dehydrogenase family enzyme